MEQRKLREKLQQRSIVPSKNSWEQLSEKLEVQEDKKYQKTGLFLKYAAIILVLVSVGFYFLKPSKQTVETPIVTAPILKEKVKQTPEISTKLEIQVAEIPVNKEIINTSKTSSNKEFVVLNTAKEQLPVLETENLEIVPKETLADEILIVEQLSDDELLDVEVVQLLKASKIKIRVNRQFSRKRVVSAQALLTEVEDDLDRDFKEKLVETIVTTLRKPRKVVITDRGN